MPSFVSKNGVWEPAIEEVAITNKEGKPEIYKGPDRAAKAFIEAEGGTVGQDASKDPQLIQASRNAGFNTVEEYLKQFAPTPQQVAIKVEADAKVVTHAEPVKKQGVTPAGSKGGFQEEGQDALSAMVKQGKI